MKFPTTTIVMGLAAVCCVASGLPSTQFDKQTKQIIESDDHDGFDIATVHAVDFSTNKEKSRSRRDIEAQASDSSTKEHSFSLHLTSGEKLRMSVQRSSVDFSGAAFTELTEDGEERVIDMSPKDCFFSGELEGGDGFASLSLCDGELVGSITTSQRDYQIHSLPPNNQAQGAADEDMKVLVTWQDVDQGALDFVDGLEMPEGPSSPLQEDEEDGLQTARRSLEDHTATVEICDVVDRFWLRGVQRRLGISSTAKVMELIIAKWSAAAHMLSNMSQAGWDINLRLVKVDIMRSNPDWYKAVPGERMGTRLKQICYPTRAWQCDQISLHTGAVIDRGIVGLAWLGGMCNRRHRCSALRSQGRNYMPELHELGHGFGLKHDKDEYLCTNGTDRVHGFMGGNKRHFRECYKEVLDKKLPRKKCIFKDAVTNSSSIVMDFTHGP